MEKKRLDYLDMAKGIGIILVVLGHSTYCNEKLLTIISSFHMPLFFVISGMLLMHINEENKPIGTIVKRKLKGIMIPYVTFSVIYILVDFYYLWKHPQVVDMNFIKDRFVEFISLNGISVLWFLPALFFAEVLFLAVRKKSAHGVTIGIFLLVGMGAILLKPIFDSKFPLQQNTAMLLLGYFITTLFRTAIGCLFLTFGYYIKIIMKEQEKVNRLELFLAIVFLIATGFISLWNGRVDLHFMVFNHKVIYFLCACIGSMGVILLCKNMKYSRVLTYFGVNSLIIMGTHLDAQVLIIAIKASLWVNQYITRGKMYFFYFGIAAAIILMEVIIIYIFNHWAYFLVGKKKIKGCEAKEYRRNKNK